MTLEEITGKTILVKEVRSGRELLIKNIEKHTHNTIIEAFDKLFARSKVNLSQFSKLEREHINDGTVVKGMRKKAVLVAIGYPPQIETMNLESNRWTYWRSKFNRFIVHFDGGKLARIQE